MDEWLQNVNCYRLQNFARHCFSPGLKNLTFVFRNIPRTYTSRPFSPILPQFFLFAKTDSGRCAEETPDCPTSIRAFTSGSPHRFKGGTILKNYFQQFPAGAPTFIVAINTGAIHSISGFRKAVYKIPPAISR